MANWVHINAGYDPGDETVLFGTRAFAESGGFIYETTTLATIQAEKEVDDVPSLSSGSIPTGGVCVSIDNTLNIFEDQSCSSIICSSSFDSKIDSFCSSPDGRFVFVGLRNGFIHFLHLPTGCQLVFSKKVIKLSGEGSTTFAKIVCVESNCDVQVISVSTSGFCTSLQNFDSDALDSACTNNSAEAVKELASKISEHVVCGVCSISPLRSVTLLQKENSIDIFAVGQGIATLSLGSNKAQWDVFTGNKSWSLVKVESSPDEKLCFALSNTGQLMMVCHETLTVQRVLSKIGSLTDFQLFVSPSSETIIVGITTPNEERHSNLVMLSLQGGQDKLSLRIKYPAKLMCSSSELEDIYFLECMSSDESPGINLVAIKAAVQTNPVFRMERMLNRRKFQEAKDLAKNFNLDMTAIHMAQARYIVEKMQPWIQHSDLPGQANHELFQDLTKELDQISDLEYVCECCLSAIPPDNKTAFLLLEYAQKRLELFVVNNPEPDIKVVDLSQRIFGTLLRLETMNLVKYSWDVDQWLSFSRIDLISEVQQFLKQGDLFEAATIWSRHKSEMKTSLGNVNILDHVLECIPPNISLDKLLIWLKHMLPVVLEMQPEALALTALWTEKKICDLERSHFRSWPQVGLEYCDKMLEVLSCQKMAGPFLGVDCSPLRPLVQLRSDLLYIHTLKQKYFIRLTLEEFRQDPAEVAVLMLDKVEVATISSLIQGYLSQFMLDRKLGKDKVISQYILEVLQCSGGWWYWDSAPWEARIAELTSHISNLELRLDCIIETLEVAPIPWSPIVSSLAESGLQLKHPLSSEIREKQKQVATNLILKKYNLKRSISKLDRRRLIRFIIKANRPEMLEDISKLAKDADEKIQFYINVLMHHTNNGDVSSASTVLWSLPKDVAVLLCPRLLQLLCQSALFGACSVDCALGLLGAVDLCHRAAAASHPPGITVVEDLDNPALMPLSISQYRNVLYLKRDFGKIVSVNDIISSTSSHRILEDCVQDLLLEVVERDNEESKVVRLYHRISYLARLLNISQSTALTELAAQLLTIEDPLLAAKISRHIEDFQGAPESFYTSLIALAENFFVQCKHLLSSQQPQKASVSKEVAQEAFNLLSKASSNCREDNCKRILNIIGWIQCWCISCGNVDEAVMGQHDATQQWRITPMYKDPGIAVLLDGSILVQFMFDAFDIGSAHGNLSSILQLPERAEKLQNDQHDLTLLLILSQLLSSLLNDPSKDYFEIHKKFHPIFIKVSEGLLTKVVSARQLDLDLGLNLLLNLGQDSAVAWLLNNKTESSFLDFHKKRQLACVGMNACRLWQMPDHYSSFRESYLLSTWGLKLREHGISGKEFLRDIGSDCEGILEKLISSKNISVPTIKLFCEDYGLDPQTALLNHLTTVLLSWDPDPLVTITSEGNKEMIERHTQQQLFHQCWEIQKSIEDKSVLCKCLYGLWKRVSFYHHEVFLVILDILEKIDIKTDINSKRLVVTFLKSYRRVKPPHEAEETFWMEVFSGSYGLPLIAQFRLPYNRQLIETPLNVVRGEITLDTYKKWQSMALALSITKDKICTIAVHETVTEVFSCASIDTKWCETIKNEALFRAVAECVAEIDDIVQAAATLFFYTSKIPPGADQVSAALLCLKYADIIVEQTGDTEYKLKVERKYITLATTQTLHSYGLGQPCYLQLINKPEELIQELYQHPNILETCRGSAQHRIDINGAAQEISECNNICLHTLHMDLILDWLQPEPISNLNNSLDEDNMSGMSLALRMGRQPNKNASDIFSQNDDNLLRARYVMESGDVQNWAMVLLSLIFGEQQGCNTGMRLRALQCVCMLTDDETLGDLSKRSAGYLRKYYRLLGFIMELEYLGLAYSESGFEACDKKDLALIVIRTSLCRPRAIPFLINLCLEYGVKDLTVWGPVLQRMVDLAMIKELEQLLPQLTCTYQLWNLTSFKKAWNLTLLAPFTLASESLSDVSQQAIFHALELFPLCPVTSALNFAETVDHCLSNKRADLCALLLPFMKISDRLPLIEKLMYQTEPSVLLNDINDLPVPEAIKNKAIHVISKKYQSRGSTDCSK